jgi:hypothetical protein
MPDALFRRTKAMAAARGITLKEMIVAAVEREVASTKPAAKAARPPRLPVIHLEPGRVLDLTNFDFDELLP